MYSKKDLIRKENFRFTFLVISLFMVVLGTRYIDLNGYYNFKGWIVLIAGIFYNFMLMNAYENLLNEANLKIKKNSAI